MSGRKHKQRITKEGRSLKEFLILKKIIIKEKELLKHFLEPPLQPFLNPGKKTREVI